MVSLSVKSVTKCQECHQVSPSVTKCRMSQRVYNNYQIYYKKMIVDAHLLRNHRVFLVVWMVHHKFSDVPTNTTIQVYLGL